VASERKLLTEKTREFSDAADTKSQALLLMLKNMSLEIAAIVPDYDGPKAVFKFLQTEYGSTDVHTLRKQLKNVKMVGVDIQKYLSHINEAYGSFRAAGGSVSDSDMIDIILDGVDQEFYLPAIRAIRASCRAKSSLGSSDVADAKQTLRNHFNDTPVSFRSRYAANNVTSTSADNRNGRRNNRWTGAKCSECPKFGRTGVAHTHSTNRCFWQSVQGWVPKDAAPQSIKNYARQMTDGVSPSNSNAAINGGPNYIAYHDTGSTPVSFFRDSPADLISKPGSVLTAADHAIPTTGTGTVCFGDLKLDDVVHVPDFDKNLVSGIQIMKAGYHQEIYQDRLFVRDQPQGTLLATGTFDPSVGLIQMDTKIVPPGLAAYTVAERRLNWKGLHEAMGHPGDAMLKRSLPAITGLTVTEVPKENSQLCEPCVLGKSRRHNRIRKGTLPTGLLDVVEMDSQGPFPVVAADGSNGNVKCLDTYSGYCMMQNTYNCDSAQSLALLKSFQAKLERRTGKRIMNIRTDGGVEFAGVFHAYLLQTGITNQQGNPYEHEIPGGAERMNQTMLRIGRAVHIASKLPQRFYCYAHQFAIYVSNRLVHTGRTKTPYEFVYGRKPNLNHLRPFGSICYSHIPRETRSKLEPSAERCRLLGFGDTDATVEHKGYLLLRESDHSVFYSRSVTFDEEQEIVPLPDEAPMSNDDGDMFYLDTTFAPSDSDSMQPDPYSSDDSYFTPDGSDSGGEIDESEPNEATSSTGGDAEVDNESSEQENISESDSGDDIVNYCAKVEKQLQHRSKYLSAAVYQSYLSVVDRWPQNLAEAQASPEWQQWKAAIDREMFQLEQMSTWEYSQLPRNKRPVKCKWVFTKKYNKDGKVVKYKARLVAKGFTQKYGTDYQETFAPVVMFKSIRTLAALCASQELKAYQDDVPSAFLRGNLKELVFMEPPPGVSLEKGQYCKLKRTLYGLKQSPREWNAVIHKFLISQGFQQLKSDPCLYKCGEGDDAIYVAVYVDDVITAGRNDPVVDKFRTVMCQEFGMEKGGPLEWYLGISFDFTNGVFLSQRQYIEKKLELYANYIGSGGVSRPLPENIQSLLESESPPADNSVPYRSMVGSLMYAMLGTRPDLCYPVSVLCRHLDKPKQIHIDLLKHVYAYLRTNKDRGLFYPTRSSMEVTGYVDAAYANNENYRSTTGFCFTVGSCLVSWYCKRQSVVAQSSAESEYYAASDAANEAVWFRELVKELGYPQNTVTLYEDNEACIALTKNPENHKRTKHIQVKYHLVRDYVDRGIVEFKYVRTKDQLADLFTKSLPGFKLRQLLDSLSVCSQPTGVGGELEMVALKPSNEYVIQ
jgi:hypothetical protein